MPRFLRHQLALRDANLDLLVRLFLQRLSWDSLLRTHSYFSTAEHYDPESFSSQHADAPKRSLQPTEPCQILGQNIDRNEDTVPDFPDPVDSEDRLRMWSNVELTPAFGTAAGYVDPQDETNSYNLVSTVRANSSTLSSFRGGLYWLNRRQVLNAIAILAFTDLDATPSRVQNWFRIRNDLQMMQASLRQFVFGGCD